MTNRDITLFKCAITRFTDATWEENVEWKRKTQDMEGKFIYNSLSPIPISLIANLCLAEIFSFKHIEKPSFSIVSPICKSESATRTLSRGSIFNIFDFNFIIVLIRSG